MERTAHDDATPFAFGNLEIRDVTPSGLNRVKLAQIEVPIGADNPPFAAAGADKVYVCMRGEVEFVIEGETARLGAGDVLLVEANEQYSYHNGGYEPAWLTLIQLQHE